MSTAVGRSKDAKELEESSTPPWEATGDSWETDEIDVRFNMAAGGWSLRGLGGSPSSCAAFDFSSFF